MSSQVLSSNYKPQIYPRNGDVAPANIDRAQSIDPTGTTNWEKVEEIGREGLVGHLKKVPTIGYRLTQYEYGSFEFYQKICNKASDVTSITLNDFKTPAFDIAAFLTDDAGDFVGTIVYPNLRTAGFSLTIGDPDAIIERSFDFVGEQAVTWQSDNKYYHYQRDLVVGDDTDYEIALDFTATLDPDTHDYMVRVLRVSAAGVTTEITSFIDTATTVTIPIVSTDDVIKLYYTSVTAPSSIFPLNNSDKAGLLADSADIYLYVPGSGSPSSADKLHRIQSVTVDVRFEREDVKEVGSREVQKRGVKDKTVTVTLGEIITGDWSIEEVLRDAGAGYGKLNIDKFTDSATLIVRIFDETEKTNFKYAIVSTGLAPRDLAPGASVNEYVKQDVTMECEDLTLTTVNPL